MDKNDRFSPFALPSSLWHVIKRRVKTVGVVTDVTTVTEEETGLITTLTTPLT